MKCANCGYEQDGPPIIRIVDDNGTHNEYCSQRCVWEHRFPENRQERLSLREWGVGGWQIILLVIGLFFATDARADDPAVHGNAGHGWYENAELTPSAKIKYGIDKCCARAEVVRTQFRVDRTTADDTWWWLDRATNTWRQIPPEIIHYDQHAPDGRPTLFIWDGKTVCFFVPEEGI